MVRLTNSSTKAVMKAIGAPVISVTVSQISITPAT